MSVASLDGSFHSLLGPNEVLVSPAIVSPAEQAELLAWTEAQSHDGKLLATPPDAGAYSTPFSSSAGGRTRLTAGAASVAGEGGQRLIWIPGMQHGDDVPLPALFWQVRARAMAQIGLPPLEEDHYKGAFISHIAPGTGVHEHRDARLAIAGENWLILRYNVLIGRPDGGGTPIIGKTSINVPERGMWVFFPTELVHAATAVSGSRFRTTLSFGFLLQQSDLWGRGFRLSPSMVTEYALDGSAQAKRTLLDSLRAATAADERSQQRIDLLAFMLDRPGDFTVRDAAAALGGEPRAIATALIDLQRSGLAESASSRMRERGRVIVL